MSIDKEGIPKYRTSSSTGASQSDDSIVVKVGDLINMAMGPTEKNTVNFKMIQTILHILARNMRLLDQQVELRSSDVNPPHLSTKERDKASRPESKDREKTAETTSKGREKAETDKLRDRKITEETIREVEKEIAKYEDKESSVASSSSVKYDNDESKEVDKDVVCSGKEKESTHIETNIEPFEIERVKSDPTWVMNERAKMKKIRKVYLREMSYLSTVDDEVEEEHLIDKEEKQMKETSVSFIPNEGDKYLTQKEKAKFDAKDRLSEDSDTETEREQYKKEMAKLANMDDEQRKKYYEYTKKKREIATREKEERAKMKKIRKVYLREKGHLSPRKVEEKHLIDEDEKQRAKFSTVDSDRTERDKKEKSVKEKFDAKNIKKEERELDEKERAQRALIETEGEKYLKQKEKAKFDAEYRDTEIEREQYQKEMEKLANMDDEQRKKYSEDKEEREKANFDAQDRERTGREKAKKAKMNVTEGGKYLKKNKKDEREKSKIDAMDREGAEGENYEKEKAKMALVNETESSKKINQKEKVKHFEKDREREDRDKEKDKARYENEMDKFANMDEENREKYFKDKKVGERADIDAQDRDRTGREMDAKEKAKLAHMDDETRVKYLKDKEEREKANIDAQDRERAGREMDAREKAKLAHMDDETRAKYLKDKEEREKANIDAKKREGAGREIDEREKLNDTESGKYLKQGEKEEREISKLHALDITSAEKEKDEKEKAKKALRNELEAEKDLGKKEKAKLDTKDREREDGHKEIESERYQNEMEKLAYMDDEQREKYFKDKQQSKEADFYAQDRERAGTEMDEREKANIAKFNEIKVGKHLKQNEKGEREKSKIDALDRERAEREIDDNERAKMALVNETESDFFLNQNENVKLDEEDREKEDRDKKKEKARYENEMDKLANMDEEIREKYIKDKKIGENANIDAQDRERTEREMDAKEKAKLAHMDDETRAKYLKDKEEREKANIDAQDRERTGREMDAKEKAKLAHMDDETRAKYLKDKEEREKANIDAQARERTGREVDAKEKAKLAHMDDETREKYLKDKEEREKTNIDAKDRERTGREMDAKEKAKLAHMNDETRTKYLKDKEEREKANIDAQARERTGREMDAKEKAKLAHMDDETRAKYLKDKEEREKSNMDAQVRERAGREMDEREKAKMVKLNETERGKYFKQEEKEETEKSNLDALDSKRVDGERENEREREKETEREREKDRDKNLKENEWAKGKVAQGSGSRTPSVDSRTRVGSIEVVTRSEFEMLEKKVNELEEKTVPIPYPSMPDNQKLRTDLAKGSASLTDTMQAMQVSARVQATESAMALMADLLTQLAASGALPEDMVEKVEEVTSGLSRPSSSKAPGGRGTSRNMKRISLKSSRSAAIPIDEDARSVGTFMDERIRKVTSAIGGVGVNKNAQSSVRIAKDGLSHISIGKSFSADDGFESKKYTGVTTASRAHFIKSCVTHPELDDAQRELKDNMIKRANEMMLRALRVAEMADMNVKRVADQMRMVSNMSDRITSLFNLINDYAEQLAGFDAGVSTQLQNFNEQIFQIRCELNDGKALFSQRIANSETEAVKELNVKYEDLVIDLDRTRNTLEKLSYYQNAMDNEIATLMKSVEAIREAKADREEILDGIRDKADKSALDKLMKGPDFVAAKLKMEQGLAECHSRFTRQEKVWMRALEELNAFSDSKATGDELFNFTYKTESDLNKMKDEVQMLSTAIGEPTAILLTRKISEGGTCGPCQAPAHQDPTADCQPPSMQAMRRHPPVPEEPCPQVTQLIKLPRHLEEREHICKRWTGGSHTLLNKSVVHQNQEAIRVQMPPTKKYAGIGKDGKMYQLEEMLQPCVDCNPLCIEETDLQEEGAGEPGVKKMLLGFKDT